MKIACFGHGMYAFIPDAGMVGTAFVNALANVLVTAAVDATLTLHPAPGCSLVADPRIFTGTEAGPGLQGLQVIDCLHDCSVHVTQLPLQGGEGWQHPGRTVRRFPSPRASTKVFRWDFSENS